MSSEFGNKIKLSIFGESHGEAIGCVIDSIPAGVKLDMEKIYFDMARRAPGKDKTATPRLEKDIPHILSGVLNGVTTGAPLAMIIENTNTKSGDYSNLLSVPRPSHSDYPAYVKYQGNNDIRGGGHFSGRLTAPLVFADAIAKQILAQKGITVGAHILSINGVLDDNFDKANVSEKELLAVSSKAFCVINDEIEDKMRASVEKARLDGDSVGGVIECAVVGVPVGIGANIFSTVEGHISSALFGVPAVKGVEFGAGFAFAAMRGSEANDPFAMRNGQVATATNKNGGINGGITNGMPLVFRTVLKPTPSIYKQQHTVDYIARQDADLQIKGRHDPCIVPRAAVVQNTLAAFGLLDLLTVRYGTLAQKHGLPQE